MNKSESLLAEVLLTDDQLKAIGCLAFESTHLEFFVQLAIRAIAGETIAKMLMHQKMLGALVDTLYEITSPRLTRALVCLKTQRRAIVRAKQNRDPSAHHLVRKGRTSR